MASMVLPRAIWHQSVLSCFRAVPAQPGALSLCRLCRLLPAGLPPVPECASTPLSPPPLVFKRYGEMKPPPHEEVFGRKSRALFTFSFHFPGRATLPFFSQSSPALHKTRSSPGVYVWEKSSISTAAFRRGCREAISLFIAYISGHGCGTVCTVSGRLWFD